LQTRLGADPYDGVLSEAPLGWALVAVTVILAVAIAVAVAVTVAVAVAVAIAVAASVTVAMTVAVDVAVAVVVVVAVTVSAINHFNGNSVNYSNVIEPQNDYCQEALFFLFCLPQRINYETV